LFNIHNLTILAGYQSDKNHLPRLVEDKVCVFNFFVDDLNVMENVVTTLGYVLTVDIEDIEALVVTLLSVSFSLLDVLPSLSLTVIRVSLPPP